MDGSSKKFHYLQDNLTSIIKLAYYSSEKAHTILFKDSNNTQNELVSSTYLNKAISYMCSAKSIYICNYELLERDEIENIFSKFDAFESEFLSNISSNHSHQWTDIEFDDFKESVCDFISL